MVPEGTPPLTPPPPPPGFNHTGLFSLSSDSSRKVGLESRGVKYTKDSERGSFEDIKGDLSLQLNLISIH